MLPRREFLNEQGLIFGACYQSTAVVPDGTAPAAVADPVTEYVPSARPGSRAPHVWLRRGAEQISTIDLFGPRFVLLAGSRGDAWRRAAQAIGLSWPPLVAHTVGEDGELERPRRQLARGLRRRRRWRGAGPAGRPCRVAQPFGGASDPAEALRAALDRVFGRMLATA